MKKSELRKIIREEVRKIKEADDKKFVVTYRGKRLTYMGNSYEGETVSVFDFSSNSWLLFSKKSAEKMIKDYKKDIEQWYKKEVPKRVKEFPEGWNKDKYIDDMKKNYKKWIKMLKAFKIEEI